MGCQHTTHEPCLSFKHHEIHGLIIVLRQVDDIIIGALEIEQQIQDNMVNFLNKLGIIKRFDGLDIQQTRDYIKISCQTHIDKIVEHHGWQNETTANLPLPMRNDSVYQANLELSYGPNNIIKEQQELETQMRFSYCQAIGELIFVMTICRLDISPAVIKLLQYSHAPVSQMPLPSSQGSLCIPVYNGSQWDLLVLVNIGPARPTTGRLTSHSGQPGQTKRLHGHG
jgi:hypothetical protein